MLWSMPQAFFFRKKALLAETRLTRLVKHLISIIIYTSIYGDKYAIVTRYVIYTKNNACKHTQNETNAHKPMQTHLQNALISKTYMN